ncbi:MAG: glycosyltransferase family 39 protein [Tepidisphaeraceae bacterium]
MSARRWMPWISLLATLLGAWLGTRLWYDYDTYDWLTKYLRRDFGTGAPLYSRWWPVDLSILAARVRLVTAIDAMLLTVVLLLVTQYRLWPRFISTTIAVLGVVGINASVAAIRSGEASVEAPFMRTSLEYIGVVPMVNDDPLRFMREYPSLNNQLTVHPGTHPPGGVLVLWAGSKLFGPSVFAATWLAIGFGALFILPARALARTVAGPAAMRRATLLCLVAPNLVLLGATSMDAVFNAFLLTALALGVIAVKKQSIWRSIVAGIALWLAAFMTFTAVLVPVLVTLYAVLSGPWRWLRRGLAVAVIGLTFLACQQLSLHLIGYDFFACVRAAMERDEMSVRMTGYESFEIWSSVSVSNLAAVVFGGGLALIGPVVVAFFRSAVRPWKSQARFALAAILGLLVLCGSTCFTLETERVLITMTPALIVAASTVLRGRILMAIVLLLLSAQTIWTELNLYTHW